MKLEMQPTFYYRVQMGDNLNLIYNKFNTCKENVLRNNPELEIYPGEYIRIKVNNFKTHIVKPAETIDKIASFYNVSVQSIVMDNALNSNKLFIGQMLKIYN